jgi:hypothetical protein
MAQSLRSTSGRSTISDDNRAMAVGDHRRATDESAVTGSLSSRMTVRPGRARSAAHMATVCLSCRVSCDMGASLPTLVPPPSPRRLRLNNAGERERNSTGDILPYAPSRASAPPGTVWTMARARAFRSPPIRQQLVSTANLRQREAHDDDRSMIDERRCPRTREETAPRPMPTPWTTTRYLAATSRR